MKLTYENIQRGLDKYKRIIQFDNGYGFSIVSHEFSYGGTEGLFEVALLCENGAIMYDKSIGFGDVVGHLDFDDVALLIKAVSALPPRDKTIYPCREVCW
jgi:hypothetical protein